MTRLLALLLLVPLWAMGQSSLPPCPQLSGLRHDRCIGSLTLLGGDHYHGELFDGKPHGQGVFTFSHGDKYVGTFNYGEFQGRGAFVYRSGNQYVGEFQRGVRSGLGVEYAIDGSVVRSGRWESGQLVSSYAIDKTSFPFIPTTSTSAHQQVAQVDPVRIERDRLVAEVTAERKRRQELEQQLATAQAQGSSRSQGSVQPATPALRAHALVIGNAAYPGSARLQNPVNDAQGVSEKLRSLGFVVTTVTDANRSRLLQAFSQFSRSAATSDVSVLYYSGHGVQIDGMNYMLPTDIDNADALQATLQGVSLNTVVENFLPGKARLVFLDACRDNPLRVAGTRSIAKGLAPISVAQGTLIAYSTRDGQVALDGLGGRYSPFTQALIEHLSDPSDIGVVLRKVREKVMQRTNGRQQPWEYGSLTGGELVLSGTKKAN
jgi:hypothetical protein